jgi:hypothetical protein
MLHLEVPGLRDAAQLQVALNGTALTGGEAKDGWVDLPVVSETLKKGMNDITITLLPPAVAQAKEWALVYDGSKLPATPWFHDKGSVRTQAALQDGALLLADRGAENGDYCYYRAPWGSEPDAESVVEARVKVVSGSSYVIFSNGSSGERLRLSPDGIGLHHDPKVRYAMNTTDDFHTYRIVLKGAGLQVHVDGVLRLDAPKALSISRAAMYVRKEIAFGASNSTDQGEALWKNVRSRPAGASHALRDVVLSVSYEKP